MRAVAPHGDLAARRLTAQRVRAARRSRHADAGTLTEMARSLLRGARDAGTAEARCRQAGVAWAPRAVEVESSSV